MSRNMKTIQPVIDNGPLTRGFSESISKPKESFEEIKKRLKEATKKGIAKPSTNPGVDVLSTKAVTTEKKKLEPATKKKRVPKPIPSAATRFLLENCMDFLNLDFEKLSHRLALTEDPRKEADIILPVVAKPLSVISETAFEQTIGRMKGCGWEKRIVLQHLNTTLSGTQKMIRMALGEGNSSVKFSAGYLEVVEGSAKGVTSCGISQWISTSLKNLIFVPFWSGAGSTKIDLRPYDARYFIDASGRKLNNEEDRFNTWIHGFRGFMVKTIGESFSAWGGEASNGAYFIGVCQCGKIFSKDNPKKSWCSDACRWTFGKRRERERQQSSA